MKFEDFSRRDDLCRKGQSRVYFANDIGVIVKVGKKWFASNDARHELIGVEPNDQLSQPTVGPLKSAKAAFEAFKEAKEAA